MITYILVIFIIILLICFFFVIKNLNKIKKEQKLTVEQLWETKKNEYSQDIEKLNKQKGALVEEYNKEKIRLAGEQDKLNEANNRLEKEIKEKQTFNSSLLKIREEELNRLIEEKKIEKEKLLEEQIKFETERRTEALNAEFVQFMVGQEEVKQRLLQETKEIQTELDDFRTQREAVNLAIALENAEEEEKNKHRISLSQQDKEDIQYLLSIEEKINNKQLLRKLIWSEYLQKPFGDMLKRLFAGDPPKNVIYCIENTTNHKKYIGKTTAEVSKRWTEHIKTSLEIGTIKSQNIHKALYGHWDDFIFSVISKTEKEKVSAEEKYYISLFESDIYGYNMKGGG